MLILDLLANETVVIGNDIKITVLTVKPSQIRMGISAPRHLQVNRREKVAHLHAKDEKPDEP
jgi:carbon storage regulator